MLFNKVNKQRVTGTSSQQYSYGIACSVYFAIVLARSSVAATGTLGQRIEQFPGLFVNDSV